MATYDEKVIPSLPKPSFDLPEPQVALPTELPKQISDHVGPGEEHGTSHDGGDGVKTLLSWHASARPFRRREKEYYMNLAVITLAVMVILFLFSQYMLMLLVVALVFLNYALTTVPPHDFRYRITTQGIIVEDHFYYWDDFYDFYFKTVEGELMAYVTIRSYIPTVLALTLGDIHRDQLQSVLIKYLKYREVVRPSFLERAGDWLSQTFPLDKRPS